MKTITTKRRNLFEALLLSTLILLWIGCRDEGSIQPFEPTALPTAFLHSLFSDPGLLPMGGRESQLTAYVVDTDGVPVEGVEVSFSSDLGSVVESAVTDENGVARAVYTSGSEKGTATVIASIGSFQLSTTILVGANELIVGSTSVVADGRSKTTVSARVFRKDGEPAKTINVTFTSTAGSIPSVAVTDSSGYVAVQLTAPASRTDLQGEITAMVDAADLGIIDEGGLGESEVIGVASIIFRGITLSLETAETELEASGRDTTVVRCLVAETVRRVPVKELEVSFGSSLGSITSSVLTDESGIAVATLRSGVVAGICAVSALVDTIQAEADVEFTPLQMLPLTATPRNILTGGKKSEISTSLLNQSNNPVPGMEVRFRTDLGVILASAYTDSMGRVAVNLVSGDSTGVATVSARFGSLSVSTEVTIGEVVSEPLKLTPLDFNPEELTADGVSKSRVITKLLNGSNNPVVAEPVEFATTLGVINASVLTDSQGVAEAWLTSEESLDTAVAYVSASYGSVSVHSEILFLPTVNKVPVSMTVTPSRPTIQVAGLDDLESAVLTAVAYDERGDPIEQGWDITFRIDSGPGMGEYITYPDSGSGAQVTVPIIGGEARTTLVAGTRTGIISVTARTAGDVDASASVGVSAGDPAHAVIGIDSLAGINMEGGLWNWKVTMAITDAHGNPVSAFTPVYVTLHDGYCGSGVLPAGMQITGNVTTENVPDCNTGTPLPGVARACLHSPYRWFEDMPSFAIEVRASADTTLDCLFIDHSSANADPASIVLYSVEDSSLAVSGVGADETSRIIFEVRDDMGQPMRAGNRVPVDFTIQSAPAGVTLSRYTDTTNAEGQVSTTVRSGTAAGVVKLKAVSGGVQSNVVNLAVHGGPPDPEHFSIAASRVNIEGLLRYGLSDTITAYVFDRYSNPVPAGMAVYFTTDFGGIIGSGVTNSIGQATAILYSAAPVPTCEDDGLVHVTATTVDELDEEITAEIDVLFTGTTTISVER